MTISPARRCTISIQHPDIGADHGSDDPVEPVPEACVAYADTWLDEHEHVRAARVVADELGCVPISQTSARALTFLAAALGAQAVVEVGTGTGVSTAALLAGMNDAGIITSIDIEAEHQRAARETLANLGYDHVRARLIAGRALDVLPRLADHAYDLVFVDGEVTEYPAILAQAKRLLRTGGVAVFDHILESGTVPDHSRRDPETIALRDTVHDIRDDHDWLPLLLPAGGGLLMALRQEPEPAED